MHFRRAPIVALALALCSASAGACSADRTEGVASPPTAPAGPDGPYAVGRHTVTFVDASRPTPAGGENPGAPSRTLVTTIWYPAAGLPGGAATDDAAPLTENGPYPLVELSHGWTATGPVYESLAREWAAAGYVVAAPTFPASSAPGGSQLLDFVNQPADVSFVLDQLSAAVSEAGNFLYGLADTDHIALTGHSLGGTTTAGLTLNSCCLDARADAAIPMAAAVFLDFPAGRYYPGGNAPVLFVNGDRDDLVPVASGEEAYAAATAPKFLLTIEGGDHVVPYLTGRSTPMGALVVDTTIAFLDAYLKERPGALDRLDERIEGSPIARLDERLGD